VKLFNVIVVFDVSKGDSVKLFNVIVVFDVYCAAETEESARAAILETIATGQEPSESNALEVTKAREIRAAWENASPFVAADISDADFETLRGKTTAQTFSMLHEKVTPNKAGDK
jgi:hypothetical protein